MTIARRSGLIAALILVIGVLFACGATTTIVQGGGGGGGGGGGSGATATATNTPMPPPTATPNPGRYNGTWILDTGSTYAGAAGEMIVTNSGPTANAQVYGQCGTICSWGTNSATVGPYSVAFSFTLGTANITLNLQLSNTEVKVVHTNSLTGSFTYYMHRGSATEIKAFLYAGNWVNNDSSTSGIPQIYITVSGTKISAHAYGKCSPTYCDWGTQTGTYTSDPLNLTYLYNTITIYVSLSLLNASGSSLQAIDYDTANPTHYTYTFHKTAIA